MSVTPTAITQDATNIGNTIARINGKITDDGGESCEARFRYRRISEDFTTYTEVDPNSHIGLVGTNHIDFAAFHNEDAYLYKDKGVDYFSNFEHKIAVKIISTSPEFGWGAFWAIANDIDDQNGLKLAGKSFLTVRIGEDADAVKPEIFLNECNNGTLYVDPYYIDYNTWYYLTIKKAGTTFTCKIYSDSIRTNLLKTLSLTLHQDLKYRYIYAADTWNGEWALHADMDIESLKTDEWTTTEWKNTLETNDEYYEDLTELDEGTEYEFQTQAKNSAGEGDWSSSAYFETEAGQHYDRSGTASLGLVGAGTRPIDCVRSDTGLLGLLATATRSWALSRENTGLLGLKATASRILTPVRAQTVLLGLEATASQAVDYAAKTGTALLGLKATGSRTIALSRSKTALLGLKATGVMSTLGHYVKEAVVYLGLAVTGTRSIVLTRVDTALLGLKATATKAITLTRADTALLGLKATGILIIPYIRTATVYLGLKITASRSFALTRLNTALLGLKAAATRSLVLSRAKTALLGLKVIGKLGAPGRALKLIIVTTQNRKVNVFTSLYRKIKVLTE